MKPLPGRPPPAATRRSRDEGGGVGGRGDGGGGGGVNHSSQTTNGSRRSKDASETLSSSVRASNPTWMKKLEDKYQKLHHKIANIPTHNTTASRFNFLRSKFLNDRLAKAKSSSTLNLTTIATTNNNNNNGDTNDCCSKCGGEGGGGGGSEGRGEGGFGEDRRRSSSTAPNNISYKNSLVTEELLSPGPRNYDDSDDDLCDENYPPMTEGFVTRPVTVLNGESGDSVSLSDCHCQCASHSHSCQHAFTQGGGGGGEGAVPLRDGGEDSGGGGGAIPSQRVGGGLSGGGDLTYDRLTSGGDGGGGGGEGGGGYCAVCVAAVQAQQNHSLEARHSTQPRPANRDDEAVELNNNMATATDLAGRAGLAHISHPRQCGCAVGAHNRGEHSGVISGTTRRQISASDVLRHGPNTGSGGAVSNNTRAGHGRAVVAGGKDSGDNVVSGGVVKNSIRGGGGGGGRGQRGGGGNTECVNDVNNSGVTHHPGGGGAGRSGWVNGAEDMGEASARGLRTLNPIASGGSNKHGSMLRTAQTGISHYSHTTSKSCPAAFNSNDLPKPSRRRRPRQQDESEAKSGQQNMRVFAQMSMEARHAVTETLREMGVNDEEGGGKDSDDEGEADDGGDGDFGDVDDNDDVNNGIVDDDSNTSLPSVTEPPSALRVPQRHPHLNTQQQQQPNQKRLQKQNQQNHKQHPHRHHNNQRHSKQQRQQDPTHESREDSNLTASHKTTTRQTSWRTRNTDNTSSVNATVRGGRTPRRRKLPSTTHSSTILNTNRARPRSDKTVGTRNVELCSDDAAEPEDVDLDLLSMASVVSASSNRSSPELKHKPNMPRMHLPAITSRTEPHALPPMRKDHIRHINYRIHGVGSYRVARETTFEITPADFDIRYRDVITCQRGDRETPPPEIFEKSVSKVKDWLNKYCSS